MAAKNITRGYFTLSTVIEILAGCLDLPENKKPSLKAKLRHLRNIGVPNVANPGTGNNIEYNRLDIIELLFALEMQNLGASPKNAAVGAQFARTTIEKKDRPADGTLIIDRLGVKWVAPSDLLKDLARRQSYSAITGKQIVYWVDAWIHNISPENT